MGLAKLDAGEVKLQHLVGLYVLVAGIPLAVKANKVVIEVVYKGTHDVFLEIAELVRAGRTVGTIAFDGDNQYFGEGHVQHFLGGLLQFEIIGLEAESGPVFVIGVAVSKLAAVLFFHILQGFVYVYLGGLVAVGFQVFGIIFCLYHGRGGGISPYKVIKVLEVTIFGINAFKAALAFAVGEYPYLVLVLGYGIGVGIFEDLAGVVVVRIFL